MHFTLMSAFVFGLLGGVHCASMCGGIVALLGSRHRMVPLRVHPGGTASTSASAMPSGATLQIAYNLGRIGSYSAAGAVAGAVGSAAWLAERILPVQQIAFVVANALLIVLGIALAGGMARLRLLEGAGGAVWRIVAPTATRLLGASSLPGALAAGAAWGWVPCGMVYGVLAAALVSGSAVGGASLMLAFGVGTLPNLLALGLAANRASRLLADSRARLAGGLLIVGFGIAGLARIDPLAQLHAAIDVCVRWLQ